jgi:hypothetical protein
MINKILVILVVGLAGCTNQPAKVFFSDNVFQDSFLKILRNVTSSESDAVYEEPVDNDDWLFLSDYKNVKYYINLQDVVVNHKTSTVAFTILNDGRKYKKEIMKEFGYSKEFDDSMPDFVAFRSILNCAKKENTIQWKKEMDKELKVKKKKFIYIPDTPEIVEHSIDSSICFTLSMMKL